MKRCVLQLMINAIMFVVKALGLADDEKKNFNHKRTKYCYVRNPNVEKGDYFQ